MKARLRTYVIAESDDIVEQGGYHYFPSADVRTDWLEKAEKTASDRACPHGVQFYDVVIARQSARARGLALRGAAPVDAPRRRSLRLLGRGRGRLSPRGRPYSQAGSFSSAASAVIARSSFETNSA